ncbi:MULTISPECIES: MFS transporter [unclassified Lactococcus]|uniref:MDR family MFS transporter n=1 Tax=unclassified Lactococcus TaxID=2643510 RepID=UPI0011C8D7C0|nr:MULTISPECIES: MFS transporter [unclassified Lactococcus]MQW22971.1 MFS transporter [Lactococcus sp. dk101]TXK44319.1 MFS transporter [Lactococcus sp. dk310]TXK50128.1 MFS transporter [Lactococcus sp. dk322]
MKDFKNLHHTIKLRLLMNFIGSLCFSTVGGSMTIYYNKYMGAGITGILLIISSVMVFLIGLYAGHLTDQRGRRPVMLFSTAVTTIGAAIATIANSSFFFNPWVTFFGFLILNFGFGFFNTASQAMIVDLTNSENRRIVYSLQYWIINFAMMIGSGLSGWFFRDYLVWLLLAITLEELLSFIVVLFWIDESFVPKLQEKKKNVNMLKAYFTVAKDKVFMYYLFASIFIAMIFNQVDYYLPVHLSGEFTSTHFLGIEIYGQRMLTIFLMLNTLIIVLLMSTMNKLTKNWSRSTGIGIGVILQGAGFIIAFLGHNLAWEVAAAIVATFGEMILVPFSQALRADLMQGEQVGTYTGAFSVTQPIASVLSGVLLSLSSLYGSVGMAIIMAGIVIIGVVPALYSIKMHENAIS